MPLQSLFFDDEDPRPVVEDATTIEVRFGLIVMKDEATSTLLDLASTSSILGFLSSLLIFGFRGLS